MIIFIDLLRLIRVSIKTNRPEIGKIHLPQILTESMGEKVRSGEFSCKIKILKLIIFNASYCSFVEDSFCYFND